MCLCMHGSCFILLMQLTLSPWTRRLCEFNFMFRSAVSLNATRRLHDITFRNWSLVTESVTPMNLTPDRQKTDQKITLLPMAKSQSVWSRSWVGGAVWLRFYHANKRTENPCTMLYFQCVSRTDAGGCKGTQSKEGKY